LYEKTTDVGSKARGICALPRMELLHGGVLFLPAAFNKLPWRTKMVDSFFETHIVVWCDCMSNARCADGAPSMVET